MLDVLPEAVAAAMPRCCGGAELLQKKRGHLEVDLFFFFLSLSFAFFSPELYKKQTKPLGKNLPTSCLLQILQEMGGGGGRGKEG